MSLETNKKCCRCLQVKPRREFNKRSACADGLAHNCRACHKQYNKVHYLNNKKLYKAVAKRCRAKRNDKFACWKTTLSCQACGESSSECLDFHHIDPLQKEFIVSNGLHQVNWKTLVAELRKCAVLCSNCHRKWHTGTIAIALTPVDVTNLDD